MERRDFSTYDAIISRAAELITQLEIGETFDWRMLFGEEEWTEITADFSGQWVGRLLSRRFTEGADPEIQFIEVAPSPRRSVFRKIREVNGRG